MSDTRMVPLYQAFATRITAYHNCYDRLENTELEDDKYARTLDWEHTHLACIRALAKQYLPHGSGLDADMQVDTDKSSDSKLVIIGCDFHHMDEHGGYDGWTEHTVIIVPSLQFGITIRITGKDRDGIKDYIANTFYHALRTMVDPNFGYTKEG